MRRLLIALASLLVAGAALAGDHYRQHSFSNIGDADECDGRHFRFNSRSSYVAEETIEAGNLSSLKVSTENAPIKVVGGNRGGYTILVCKAAELEEDLGKIHVTVSGGELRADGPTDNDWIVAYRILAPDRANLDVETRNGPISFRDLKGTVNASVSNGPVSLENVDGEVDVTAKNGPISVDGGSGNFKVRASNGPLSIQLDGTSFNGTLDATTHNGPLSVKLPRGYNTSVVVEARGHGPISCHAEGCGKARSNSDWWDDNDNSPRRIELGNGPENVHISTVNGPVTIREN
jgi:hypothetical protein